MTLHEIYTTLANRMIGAMMIHSQLVQVFAFVDLLPDMRRQESQLQEETHGYSELNKYYTQHHHNILLADNPPQIDLLNLSVFSKSTEELTPEDKSRVIQYGINEWIKWERKSAAVCLATTATHGSASYSLSHFATAALALAASAAVTVL